MKFTITFKDPDAPLDCIQEAAEEWAKQAEGLDDDERAALVEQCREKLRDFTGK